MFHTTIFCTINLDNHSGWLLTLLSGLRSSKVAPSSVCRSCRSHQTLQSELICSVKKSHKVVCFLQRVCSYFHQDVVTNRVFWNIRWFVSHLSRRGWPWSNLLLKLTSSVKRLANLPIIRTEVLRSRREMWSFLHSSSRETSNAKL